MTADDTMVVLAILDRTRLAQLHAEARARHFRAEAAALPNIAGYHRKCVTEAEQFESKAERYKGEAEALTALLKAAGHVPNDPAPRRRPPSAEAIGDFLDGLVAGGTTNIE